MARNQGPLSALSPRHSALSAQPSALSPQRSALSPQRSALSPQPSALSPQRSALSAQPFALTSLLFAYFHAIASHQVMARIAPGVRANVSQASLISTIVSAVAQPWLINWSAQPSLRSPRF